MFRYRYDTETGLYYLNSRYYNPDWGRFINADSLGGDVGTLLSHNLFAYCMNNPVNMTDENGYWPNWNKMLSGAGLIAIGVIAVATAATVITGGAAAPALVAAIAWTTAVAGGACVAYGASEVVESVTGYNAIRDGLMGGNSELYNSTRSVVKTTTEIGSIATGGLGAATKALQNAGKIPIKIPISQLKNNPLDEFVTLGPKPGKVGEYISSICRTGEYANIYATKLGNGLYQIADGHHRVQALRQLGYQTVKIFITK